MPVTGDTYIRELPMSVLRGLSLRLDRPMATHQDWRGMAALLPRRPGSEELKYNAMQLNLFEQVWQRQGGSPTESVLLDWGTTNARVSDLLKVLGKMEHLAAMDTVLPGSSQEYVAEHPNQDVVHPEPPRKIAEQPEVPPRPADLAPRVPQVPADLAPQVPQVPRRPAVESTEPALPDSTTRLPVFNPQIVQRFSFEEVLQMTRHFDERKVRDGGTLIDEGGFGVVFRGRFSQDEPCAVKKLKEKNVSENIDIEKQFDSELKALCKLRHPNLVMLYGYCYEPPNLCLVYELMTGGSLGDRLSCKGGAGATSAPLTWPKRLNIALDAASGIRFLHDKGFIHRDIKSGNILLDGNLTAKVCDFGLVRDKSDKLGGGTSHYQTSVTIGSTAYMAPEAFLGQYSKKTDVYSFGLVLLELLTGLPVYDETHILTRVDDTMEATKDDVLALIDRLANLGDERSARVVYDLATRCTSQKERRRPDITEIVQQLETVQATTPTM